MTSCRFPAECRYHAEFVRLCNLMDEIWVPSRFSLDTLAASGVQPEKLRIVPIAVNTTLFDPGLVWPVGTFVV